MKKISAFLVLVVIFCSFMFHDFHTSMTKIEYNPANKTLKLVTKIDVEQVETTLGKKIDAPDIDNIIQNYFYKNLEVNINDQNMKYVITGKQISGDLVWVYYEIENVSSINVIGIKNSLFIDKNPNQQNFVSFNINGKRGSFMCAKGKEFEKQQL